MSTTKIEWAEAVWNPITGCTKVSPGCANCYAERMAKRLQAMGIVGYDNVIKSNGNWTGHVNFMMSKLEEPLRWKKPRKIFVNSMSDLFHEKIDELPLDMIWDIMERASQHVFLILTKRAYRMAKYIFSRGDVLPNVWLGVSVEDQRRADERIPWLLQTPAAVRFVSAMPLLGPVDIASYLRRMKWTNRVPGRAEVTEIIPRLDWVICGGESGPGARPMHPDWARSLRDQCQAAGVPFLFKQWGAWALKDSVKGLSAVKDFGVLSPEGDWYHLHTGWNGRPEDPDTGEAYMINAGKHRAGRFLDGKLWDEYPDFPPP